MSAVRTLYHPLKHIWLRAKEPVTKETTRSSYRILELGLTERGLEDIGDFSKLTFLKQQLDVSKRNFREVADNEGSCIRRGDGLVQIHYDGHSISSADELYHTVWESFSDHMSIISPVSGRMAETEPGMGVALNLMEQEGIDEESVLMGIETTEDEWEDVCRQNDFVSGLEYFEIVKKQPRGAFY